MEENISMFAGITGANADVARGFLELTSGDLERAIELFFENPELVSGVGAGVSNTGGTSGAGGTSATASTSRSASRRRPAREDASGVIHIPSDDDDDIMEIDDGDEDFVDDDEGVGRVAARAQEEEDAAMAKRLQEELYQGGSQGAGGAGGPGGVDDDVRAPIGRTTETLVAPEGPWGGDDGGAMETAFLDQLRRRRNMPARTGGPFGQRIWGDGTAPQDGDSEGGSHAQRLADLFRPPYDLMARLSWDEARTLGKEDKKWILVNLQDMSDFNCQALNRDIWKDAAIKELVSENFIFLQYDKEHPDSDDYVNFYFHNREHENPENYPHVSIIDPRTGEQVKIWGGRPFPSAVDFHAELAEFLDRYSLAANSKNPVAKATAPKPNLVNVDRMTEDEMLEMALKNSLASGAQSSASGSGSTPNMVDPDSLTKSVDLGTADKGKEVETAEPPAEASAFSQISSTNPHTEPENDPATTTRIQFRHPNGRVIRRFRLDDNVRSIFEWLKADPFEGKEGVEFELKKMPQGQDLIDCLDSTIAENGLKQGTVMIEFIED